MQDRGAVEVLRHDPGPGPAAFDDAGGDAGMVALQIGGQGQADIAAADDDDAPRLALLMAESGHGAGHMAGLGDEKVVEPLLEALKEQSSRDVAIPLN